MWIKTIVVAVVLISVELIAGFSLYHNCHIFLWTVFQEAFGGRELL